MQVAASFIVSCHQTNATMKLRTAANLAQLGPRRYFPLSLSFRFLGFVQRLGAGGPVSFIR